MNQLQRRIAEYYLSLRLSALAVMPVLEAPDIEFPAPIVRPVASALDDGWDPREIVSSGGRDFVVTSERSSITRMQILPN